MKTLPRLTTFASHHVATAPRSAVAELGVVGAATLFSMKHTILALLFCIGLLHLHAADEPLIPAALNAVLPGIHAGMTIPEVEAVLSAAYPGVKGQTGHWSGQTGYIEYKLDERHTLDVSSITSDGKAVVHSELLFYLYDRPAKRRLDLNVYDWAKQADTAKHEANGGHVADATAATDIAKIVLRHLLTPDDLKHKQFFDATLKDGVWTVECREPKSRISFPILIQIRQKTGGVVKYEDPNA